MEATGPTFAELVDQAARTKGLNDYQLSAAIGLMPGNRVCSPKQVSRIRKGEQVHYNPDLVSRLVEVLDLDADPETEAAAWFAAGVKAPWMTQDDYREIVSRRRRSDRQLEVVPAKPATVLRGPHVQSGDCTEALRAA